MGTLLAPYNSAMRLGAGFNSFKQQLCVNSAVLKESREPATMADLRSTPAITNETGETSQSVTWTAEFVDKASEVFKSLDISGSLAIKMEAANMGARGEGAYLNVEKMKGSDISYLIQVKVVNQRLVGQDVTRFNAIPNIPQTSFTDVYGDCFISGFLEGGDFAALLTTKLEDKSDLLKVSGAIEAQFKAGPVNVDAKARGAYENLATTKGARTSISVSWTGGGNIRGDQKGREWTLSTMQSAALTFPEQCAKFPQYTHAILTKYTSLRSYQELTNKGSPLDYENAGVYTSSLLDAYMEYKEIWSNIATMTRRLQGNLQTFRKRTEDEKVLLAYSEESRSDHARRLRAYYGTSESQKTITVPNQDPEQLQIAQKELANVEHQIIVAKKKLAVVQKGDLFNPPMKPNSLKPYESTLFDLDRARRDCRWEMIKIVKEVDEVANDPHIAVDTDRIWVYLNPVIFKQLLPAADPPLPPYSPEYVNDLMKATKDELDIKKTELENKKTELESKKTELAKLQDELKTEQGVSSGLRTTVVSRDATIKILQKDSDALVQKDQQIKVLEGHLVAINQTSDTVKAVQRELAMIARMPGKSKPPTWGKMLASAPNDSNVLHSARYGITYPQLPKTLYAVSHVRSNYISGLLGPLNWDIAKTEFKNDGFELTTAIAGDHEVDVHCMEYSWMTLPNNEVNFNFGYINFDGRIDRSKQNEKGVIEVTFPKPYKTKPATPIVWCATVAFGYHGSAASQDGRFKATVGDVTVNGFTFTVETWGGSCHDGEDWGWCAWDQEYDGVKVIGAKTSWGSLGSDSFCEGGSKYWEPVIPAGKTPVSILTGFSGIDYSFADKMTFCMDSSFMGTLGIDGRVRYGPDSSIKARWAEAMYIMILEDA